MDAKLAPAETIDNLVLAHVFEDIYVALSLKDAPVVNVYVKLPMISNAMDTQGWVFWILGQKAELFVKFPLYLFG